MRKLLGWLTLVAALPLLGGCAVAVLGGAAAGGVLLAEDRRTVGTMTEDQGIELKAGSRIGERVRDAHLNITSFNRLILLTGEVPNAAAREDAERIARAVENVRGVFNEVQVAGNTALSSRTNDAYLTSLKTPRTFSTARATRSASSRAAALGTSPVSNISRLKLVIFRCASRTRSPMRLPALSSMP